MSVRFYGKIHTADVGTLALTGLGVCLPIILLVSAFAALCASSGAPLASIAMGQRNHEKAEGILGSCTALLLCVSAVLTVVLSCFYTPILLAFGATEDALPYAQRYIAIYSLGTVLLDFCFGDPYWLPHPVVWIGKGISAAEKQLRKWFPETPSGLTAAGASRMTRLR